MVDVLTAAKLTIKEACGLARVSRGTLYRWMDYGVRGRRLPSLKFGDRVYILRDDLLAFAERRGAERRTDAPVLVRRREATPDRAEAALQKLARHWAKTAV
jgi:excisionase family DNA binding protein